MGGPVPIEFNTTSPGDTFFFPLGLFIFKVQFLKMII